MNSLYLSTNSSSLSWSRNSPASSLRYNVISVPLPRSAVIFPHRTKNQRRTPLLLVVVVLAADPDLISDQINGVEADAELADQ